jgi:sialate O-acetylesterase
VGFVFLEQGVIAMFRKLMAKGVGAVLVLLVLAAAAAADVRLPGVFGDHMVLQRDAAVPVWGLADPAEKVTVTMGDQSKTAVADSAGKWSVRLDAMKAGGPFDLKVQGTGSAVQLSDVLVGEVWLCSGQSNMAMTVSGVRDKDAEIAAATFPKIRVCAVARKTAAEPQADAKASWKVCSPKTVAGFSAAAYFFGRELHRKLDVPVGLIDSSWGGTPIQAWTDLKAQESVPDLASIAEGYKRAVATYNPEAAKKRYEKQLAAWKESTAKGDGEGKSKAAAARKPQPPQEPTQSPNSPATLYNGMIAPLAPYAIRGAIWYQGESDAGRAERYGLQLKTMITNWRGLWKQGDFAFLFVQLPNFMPPQKEPVENGGWPSIREQFVKTLAVPNTGMAVTIDIGEAGDIHPKNKQDVGFRLAQWALAKNYGMDVIACGPLYKSMNKQGSTIALAFDYGDGLAARNGEKLKGFAIAGEDKKFVWAEAKIEGAAVIVSSPQVAAPAAVRYDWANNPDGNLVNKAGLAASPFRTDEW